MTSHEGLATGRTDAGDAFYAALLEDDPEELYDAAPCGYFSTLADGTIVKVNRTFLTWTGYRREALIGRQRFHDLLPPGDRIYYETHLAPGLAMQGLVREIAVDMVCSSGARLPVLLNAVLKRDPAGNPTVVRAAIIDATERRSYERELLDARWRAEESEARTRALADTLQRIFLPPSIPPVPGVDIAGVYRPAGDGTEVGGDFYDVFVTGEGSPAVALGDVCGKGAQAAVLTALARYTIRAEALRRLSPRAVLSSVHRTFLHYHPDDFCTALFAVLHRSGDQVGVIVASGGHPPPIRLSAAGQWETLSGTGRILGMLPTPHVTETSMTLLTGDVLVLYTDGVVEARRDGELFGQQRLCSAVAAAASGDAQHVADAVAGAALRFQEGQPWDDIAVVVLKVL